MKMLAIVAVAAGYWGLRAEDEEKIPLDQVRA